MSVVRILPLAKKREEELVKKRKRKRGNITKTK
jgi:hypothetical protein